MTSFKEILAWAERQGQINPSQESKAGEGHLLHFRSAADIARETPATVPWIAEPWIAEGSITELDGKIKAGGKTTWLLALCRKVLDGEPFMGLSTKKSPVVFLTEQPMSSFREALRRADLLSRDDFMVLPYHDTLQTAWPQVVEAAARECEIIGAKLLAVDTLPQFADISGDSENSSGAALTALGPVQAVAALGIGIVCVRHDRKAGGDVGESGRGSSAWGGVCDTIISIRRGDGAAKPTMRILQTLSRFEGPPDKLVIDLQNGEYVALGTETKVVEQETRNALWAAMPESDEYAKSRDELFEAAEVKPTVGKAIIKNWYSEKYLGRVGAGKSGNPHRFWKLDIGQSEVPGVATNHSTEPESEERADSPKYRSVAYRNEVPTNQYSSPDYPVETPETSPDSADADGVKSRSVGTTTLISDQPINPDIPDDVEVV